MGNTISSPNSPKTNREDEDCDLFFNDFPQIRTKVYKYTDQSTLLSLRQTCSRIQTDIDEYCIFDKVIYDDSQNMDFVHSIKIRHLIIRRFTKCNAADNENEESSSRIENVLRAPNDLLELTIQGEILWTNFNLLTSFTPQLIYLRFQLCRLMNNYYFLDSPSMDGFPRITILEIDSTSLIAKEIQNKIQEDKNILLMCLTTLRKISGSLILPNLVCLNIQLCFFDSPDEILGACYSHIIYQWISTKNGFPKLKDFRVNMSWTPYDSFVKNLVSWKPECTELNEASSLITPISDHFQENMEEEEDNNNLEKDCCYELEKLKMIWDFSTMEQAEQWKIFVLKQKNLKFIEVGFCYPVKWSAYKFVIRNCSETLVYISLHNLAVWDLSVFSPVDLSIFSSCFNLRSLHLTLAIFQLPHLPPLYAGRTQIVGSIKLPKSIEELSLIRFTIPTLIIKKLVFSLSKLRIIKIAFLGSKNFGIGLDSKCFIDILKRMSGQLKKIFIMDFCELISPIVQSLADYNKDKTSNDEILIDPKIISHMKNFENNKNGSYFGLGFEILKGEDGKIVSKYRIK